MAASIYDVAKRAQVSISTVSRILNNTAVVSEKKKEAVREAIAFYQYEPNQFARGLVKQKTGMIGVYFPSNEGSIFSSSFYLELLKGIETVLGCNGYSLVLIGEKGADEEQTRPKFQEYMAQKRIDGLLLCGILPKSLEEQAYKQMRQQPFPMVYIGKKLHEKGNHVYVPFEDYMYRMIQTLYEHGHRKIILYHRIDQEYYINKLKQKIKMEYPAATLCVISDPGFDSVLRLQLLLSLKKYVSELDYSAICSPSMALTQSLLSVCSELQLSIPEKVSIVSVEHRRGEGELIYPPMSACYVPAETMGQGAARMLLDVINGEESLEPMKEYEISYVERESVRDYQ